MRKAVAPVLGTRFARELQAWVTSSCGGDQTVAGRTLGVSQAHISALVNCSRGPGLNVVIAFCALVTRSVEDVLALQDILPPPPSRAPRPMPGWRLYSRRP